MINTDPNHKHTYDEQGKMTCCTLEDKIYAKAEEHSHEGHNHDHEEESAWKEYLPAIISFVVLMSGIILDNFIKPDFFKNYVRLVWYIVAYIPVGIPVLKDAVNSIAKGSFFSEFFLMSIATIGAFFIGEYSEGVAVMLFYAVGELFQSAAVKRAKRSIKALLDVRPDTVTVIRNGSTITVSPSEVKIGEVIQVKPGEKVALDGELISETSAFNTAALTGESKPDTKRKSEHVLAGMINLNTVSEIKVTALFQDSKLSRILELVQEATARKAPTQLFISKFAKIYTPIVVFLAIGICLLPALFVKDYVFNDWLYRALVFLVISCPCALVISIPLGYFGGIGLASRNGILFKGSNYLDVMTKIDTVVMDKTGTLTKGVFKVQKIVAVGIEESELLTLAAGIESKSTHPIAIAITQHVQNNKAVVETVEEIAGHGLKGVVNSKQILAGNAKLLRKFNIAYDTEIESIVESIVVIAVNNKYAGYITVADEIKEDAPQAIVDMHKLNLKVVMLSGDKQSVVDKVAKELHIVNAFGNLLPEDKVNKVQALKNENRTIAFVGDGVNDAPVIALADAGIAMGGLGSDATIETADVVIQNDMPSKIVTAIKIGNVTRKIVWQNITMAMVVKIIVLALGAGGVATLWEAVFADVGVALVAILNAVRIQNIKFH
ncbi:MAG: heavy metal translocating P-type ATPase [Bacteroidia bacterium]|nr:cadmium-translocating P-type ATPase [Bacteroidota bacterium]